MEPSRTACAGAAAAFLLRRIASRAGSYAPGIQDRMFLELQRRQNGAGLDQVWSWFGRTAPELHRLGYRLGMRRVAFRTPGILRWVEDGGGYRGAVLVTDRRSLLSPEEPKEPHAVALTVESTKRGKAALRLVDPWPGEGALQEPPATLEAAHRKRQYGSLVVYWSGWS